MHASFQLGASLTGENSSRVGVMLGHERVGHGARTIVVMNDWMSDTSSWSDARKYLDCERFSWLFVDLRGYGRSRAIAGEYSLREAAADVLALDVDHFDVVGHSMSTLIALHLGQHHPERLRSVTVLTPPPPAGFGAEPGMLAAIQALARADDAKRAHWLRMRFGEQAPEGWVRFKATQWRASAEPEAVAAYAAMFARDGLPDPSAKIQLPVLAITGDQDEEIMRRDSVSRLLGPLAAQLSVHEIPGCGHYPMQETPVQLVAALERFLQSAQ